MHSSLRINGEDIPVSYIKAQARALWKPRSRFQVPMRLHQALATVVDEIADDIETDRERATRDQYDHERACSAPGRFL